jgi:GntR family transcriptional repressor for pyruvate dehydrogenase complex
MKRLPGKNIPGFNITAFELTEARLLFEGEAAALAATQITDEELAELEALVEEIERENRSRTAPKRPTAPSIWPSRAPPATRMAEAVERLWDLRAARPKARCCTKRPAAPTSSRWSTNTPPCWRRCARTIRPPRARPRPSCRRARQPAVATEEKAIAEARRAARQARTLCPRHPVKP